MTSTDEKSKQHIGFLGTGLMGNRMAQRLLDAGYQVAVYDRTPEKAQDVGRKGQAWSIAPKPWQRSATWCWPA